MRNAATLIMAALLSATVSLAADPKTLYVKAHEAKVLKEPEAAASELGTVHFGDEVTWLGAAAKPFHKVSATVKDKKKRDKKVEGYLLQQNLTAKKPEEAVASATGTKESAQAFASSAAATKAMSGAGLSYAARKGSMEQALKGIISTESVALGVTDKDTQELGCAVNGGCK